MYQAKHVHEPVQPISNWVATTSSNQKVRAPCARIQPHNGIVAWSACAAPPHHSGFPLVGNANRSDHGCIIDPIQLLHSDEVVMPRTVASRKRSLY
jgi:hypothetical protein